MTILKSLVLFLDKLVACLLKLFPFKKRKMEEKVERYPIIWNQDLVKAADDLNRVYLCCLENFPTINSSGL